MSLKLSGEATEADLQELSLLLQTEPSLSLQMSMIEESWSALSSPVSQEKHKAFDRHLQRLSQHLNEDVLKYEDKSEPPIMEFEPSGRGRIYLMLKWTVGIAASVMLAWWSIGDQILALADPATPAQNSISTRRGSKTNLELPDGTKVWLNADSKITYNEEFQGRIREVNLSGEAFFDVAHDATRPFIIHTNLVDIKVLGTAFNVRSYADEESTETSLVRGSVEVSIRNHPDKKFTLKPNDKLVINNDELQMSENDNADTISISNSKRILLTWGKINYASKQDTVATEALWTKNKLAFDKDSFEEIARKLERWYDIQVEFKNEKLRNTEFSIIIEDESLQQVMHALQEAGKFQYEIEKKTLRVW